RDAPVAQRVRQLADRLSRSPPPGLIRVVLEDVRARVMDRVRHPGPREHCSVCIDGDRFDRRRPDIESDRNLRQLAAPFMGPRSPGFRSLATKLSVELYVTLVSVLHPSRSCLMSTSARPQALVLAPFRGPGLQLLQEVCDVTYDPWIEHSPAKMHSEEELAKRLADIGATVLVCESDNVRGPVLDAPLTVIGSTRGDPTNVDVAGATAKGIPVLNAPGRNADAVAELTVGLLFAATRWICFADRETRAGQMYRDGTIPYQRFR